MENTFAEFDLQLNNFLIQKGFTHIWCSGINNPKANSIEIQDYLIIPLQPNDPRINSETASDQCLEITSLEVQEMAMGADTIRFLIQLENETYLNYLANA